MLELPIIQEAKDVRFLTREEIDFYKAIASCWKSFRTPWAHKDAVIEALEAAKPARGTNYSRGPKRVEMRSVTATKIMEVVQRTVAGESRNSIARTVCLSSETVFNYQKRLHLR